MKPTSVMRRMLLAATATLLLTGCSAIQRLATIGEPPPLSAINNPTTRPGYKPVQMPMPAAQPASYNPNSLWR
ncbi:MAG TPA: lipoprotein, partial [Pseudolabrys sp.]|nr:lipoprotein [Pseudolabrys sp.]